MQIENGCKRHAEYSAQCLSQNSTVFFTDYQANRSQISHIHRDSLFIRVLLGPRKSVLQNSISLTQFDSSSMNGLCRTSDHDVRDNYDGCGYNTLTNERLYRQNTSNMGSNISRSPGKGLSGRRTLSSGEHFIALLFRFADLYIFASYACIFEGNLYDGNAKTSLDTTTLEKREDDTPNGHTNGFANEHFNGFDTVDSGPINFPFIVGNSESPSYLNFDSTSKFEGMLTG